MAPHYFLSLSLLVAASACLSRYMLRRKHEVTLTRKQAVLASSMARLKSTQSRLPDPSGAVAEFRSPHIFQARCSECRVEEVVALLCRDASGSWVKAVPVATGKLLMGN